ncbi:hypothetical protein GPECTOR_9g666 [Gonium pectorale]|uniref:ATP-dependent RNA helicase n=1 Tax=Gonium pectorale TaxID=33097 RepID=A0A150GS42_GONPE|nr:hypothetical protein GPECTOR_9g666 [Gonium pectorale]|eukprot:KXZ52621.1 hypothetical protein GPECTOR_9g666 [Gonium pectorale]
MGSHPDSWISTRPQAAAAAAAATCETLINDGLRQWPTGPNLVGAVLLAPTRERAEALQEAAFELLSERAEAGHAMGMRAIHGGTRLREDVAGLRAQPPDLLVATPGRLTALLTGDEVKLGHLFESLRALVLDGGEKLGELGFLQQARRTSPAAPAAAAGPPMTPAGLLGAASAPVAAAPVSVEAAAAAVDALVRVALRPGYVSARVGSLLRDPPAPAAAAAMALAAPPLPAPSAAAMGTAPTAAAGHSSSDAYDRNNSVRLPDVPYMPYTLADAVAEALGEGASTTLALGGAAVRQQPAAPPSSPPPLYLAAVPYEEHMPYLYAMLRQHVLSQGRHKVVVQFESASLAALYAALFQALGFQVAQAHCRVAGAGRAAAAEDFAAAQRGLLFTTDVGGPGGLGGGEGLTLVVWPWSGPLDAVRQRLGVAVRKVPPELKQLGLEGLLGSVAAASSAAAAAAALQHGHPGAASPGGGGGARALGELLGSWARRFALVMGMPSPPQLNRQIARRLGLSSIPGVALVDPPPPPPRQRSYPPPRPPRRIRGAPRPQNPPAWLLEQQRQAAARQERERREQRRLEQELRRHREQQQQRGRSWRGPESSAPTKGRQQEGQEAQGGADEQEE